MPLDQRIVVAITGASTTLLGIRLLELLQGYNQVETHLILSQAARATLHLESETWNIKKVKALAQVVYNEKDITAPIASGTFPFKSMVVIPCSMKTLAAIACGYGDNLIHRAADVALKERRTLIVVPRETPLHLGHLRNMTALTEMGGIVLPPSIALYHKPKTILDLIDHTVGKVLDLLGLTHTLFPPWGDPDSPA